MAVVKELLTKLDLGSSVAEFDEDLLTYFVETHTFKQLIQDKFDIIAGDKGTGKTAIFRILQDNQDHYRELDGINIVQAFNPQGSPIFQRLTKEEVLNEGDYILLWKSYILAVIGNFIIKNDSRLEGSELDLMLKALNIRSQDISPRGIFRKIIDAMPNFFRWDSAEVEMSFTNDGMPVVTNRVNFRDGPIPKNEANIQVEDAFYVLDRVLRERSLKVWVAIDRLDEAFQGYPDIEVSALRALLRTYLDLTEFGNFKLKLFLRKDLFRRITAGGFVNLTHVNDKKLEIIWDEEDLLHLLCRRVRGNEVFMNELSASAMTDLELFDRIFPDQVDVGERKPVTWTWMMGRIRDGNDVKPPRNLIDLVNFSKQSQIRKEEREKRQLDDDALIESEAIRRGLKQLSDTRVGDTLLAEAGNYAPTIERFRESKSEHNLETLAKVLQVSVSEAKLASKPLVDLGFLEEVGSTYKIPMLYRDGLEITQGKAF